MKTLLVIAAFVVLACVIVALCEAIASMFSTDKDAGVIMPDDYRAEKCAKEQRETEIYEFTILTRFLPGLINCDTSNLSDEEAADLDEFKLKAHLLAERDGYVHGHIWDFSVCVNYARCEITGMFGDVSDVRLVCW